MKTLRLTLAVLACATALPQWSLAATQPLTTLSPIVVTASRVPQSADASLSSVTVITRKDIRDSGALNVLELLQGRAGIELTSNGGYGKHTSLFMRGTGSDAVLVLIDGVRAGSVSSGGFSWEFLPLSQIQRIEIVRGPHSVQYGADAVGGVIQIFTTRRRAHTTVNVNVGAGTYTTRKVGAGLSGGDATSWYSVRAEHLATHGFDVYKLADPDSDGYDNTSLSASAGHRFAHGVEWQAEALQATGNTQYDRIPYLNYPLSGPNQDNYKQQVLSTRMNFHPLAAWKLTLLAGRSLDNRNSLLPNGSLDYRYDSTRKTYSWQNDFSLGDNQILTAGVDRYQDSLNSTTTYTHTRRTTRGLFAQYIAHYDRQSVQVGVRRSRDDQFGTHNTGSVAWAYRFDDAVRLRLSQGSAFRAPTFNDLYYPYGYGNPNLKPENSRTDEIGLSGLHHGLNWQLNAYRTRIDNLIVSAPPTYVPYNVGKAQIDGLEVIVSGKFAGLTHQLSLTLLNPRDANSGKLLPRRSKQSLRWTLSRRLGRTMLGATLIAQSWRYDDAANTQRVAGYGTINLRAQYRLARGYTVFGRLGNIFNKSYETVKNYNTAGRTLFVGIRYQGR